MDDSKMKIITDSANAPVALEIDGASFRVQYPDSPEATIPVSAITSLQTDDIPKGFTIQLDRPGDCRFTVALSREDEKRIDLRLWTLVGEWDREEFPIEPRLIAKAILRFLIDAMPGDLHHGELSDWGDEVEVLAILETQLSSFSEILKQVEVMEMGLEHALEKAKDALQAELRRI